MLPLLGQAFKCSLGNFEGVFSNNRRICGMILERFVRPLEIYKLVKTAKAVTLTVACAWVSVSALALCVV